MGAHPWIELNYASLEGGLREIVIMIRKYPIEVSVSDRSKDNKAPDLKESSTDEESAKDTASNKHPDGMLELPTGKSYKWGVWHDWK